MAHWWSEQDRGELALLESIVRDQAQEIVDLERERRQLIDAIAEALDRDASEP